MTREEAINLLEHISIAYTPTDAYGDYDDPQPYEEAIDMAIKALQKDIERHKMVIRASERHLGIVRCKNCKWWNCKNLNYQHNNHLCRYWSKFGSINTSVDDFCSNGERKDESEVEE